MNYIEGIIDLLGIKFILIIWIGFLLVKLKIVWFCLYRIKVEYLSMCEEIKKKIILYFICIDIMVDLLLEIYIYSNWNELEIWFLIIGEIY